MKTLLEIVKTEVCNSLIEIQQDQTSQFGKDPESFIQLGKDIQMVQNANSINRILNLLENGHLHFIHIEEDDLMVSLWSIWSKKWKQDSGKES